MQRLAVPASLRRGVTVGSLTPVVQPAMSRVAREVSAWRRCAGTGWLMEARRRTHVEETGRKLCAAAHTSTAEAAHCDVATVPLSAYVPNRLKKLEPVRNEMPLVVVLHGLLGNANNWRSMLTRADFLPGFYSVSVDLRNHGKSGWAPTNSWAEMSNDVLAFAAGFGVHDACLLGHSMGGKVAMHIALEFPERVRSLVVVDIAPVNYTGTMMHETVLEGMASLDLDSISSTADARELLSPFVADAATREFVLTNLTLNPATKKYSWKVNLDALCDGIRNGSLASFPVKPGARYDGPCLFVRGGRSPYIKDEYRARTLELFPNAEFATIDRAGHWPHAELPEDFLEVVNDWFQRPENVLDPLGGGPGADAFFPRT